MRLRIFEGTQIYENGVLVGPLELEEGKKSEPMVLIEDACFADIHEVELTEIEISYNNLQESLGKTGKGIILALEGRFQMAGTLNANKRVYPDEIWTKTLESGGKHMSRCREHKMLGECDHPKDGTTLLNRVSHMITELWRNPDDSKEILGRLVVFDTEKGRIIKAIHEGGGRLGVSSRGKGSVVKQGENFIVQGDFDLDTFDVVHNPSTPGAYPTVTESLDPKVEHQENTEMSKQLQSLQETLSRLMKHEVSKLNEAALSVISEEVETAKITLTTELFGAEAPKAAVLAVEAVNFLRDIESRRAVLESTKTEMSAKNDILGKPGKPAQPVAEEEDDDKEKKKKKDDDEDQPSGKIEAAPTSADGVKESISGFHDFIATSGDVTKIAKQLTEAYRLKHGIEGKLPEIVATTIKKVAEDVATKLSESENEIPIKATIHFGSLNESAETLEISATSEANLRRSIEERIKGHDTGIVFVEIDRSESIYKECTDRFEPLIESQVIKTAQAAEEGAMATTELSEMSAKLAGAAQIIENLASRVKASDGNLSESLSREAAAIDVLEAIVQEFRAERLKGTVAGIAATHQVDGLSERLIECTTPQEAIVVTMQRLSEVSNIVREPLPGLREDLVDRALAADAEQRQVLEEKQRNRDWEQKNTNRGGKSPMVESTNRVVDRMKQFNWQ